MVNPKHGSDTVLFDAIGAPPKRAPKLKSVRVRETADNLDPSTIEHDDRVADCPLVGLASSAVGTASSNEHFQIPEACAQTLSDCTSTLPTTWQANSETPMLLARSNSAGAAQNALLECVERIGKLSSTRMASDEAANIFIALQRAIARVAAGQGAAVAAEALCSEDMELILRFIGDFHQAKKIYRRQTLLLFSNLLNTDAWTRILQADAGLFRALPEELQASFRTYIAAEPQEDIVAPLPASPRSDAIREAVSAARDRQALHPMRRTTRQLPRTSHRILETCRVSLQDLNFSAEGDADDVGDAFDELRRAVHQAVQGACKEDYDSVDAFEPKTRVLDFLAELINRRRKYKSRVTRVLSELESFGSWHELVQARPYLRTPCPTLAADDGVLVTSCSVQGHEDGGALLNPLSSGFPQQIAKIDEERDDALELLEILVRSYAPWYLRICLPCFGVVGAVRKCRCFVPSALHPEVELLLDRLVIEA